MVQIRISRAPLLHFLGVSFKFLLVYRCPILFFLPCNFLVKEIELFYSVSSRSSFTDCIPVELFNLVFSAPQASCKLVVIYRSFDVSKTASEVVLYTSIRRLSMNVRTYFCDISNHWWLCLGLFFFFLRRLFAQWLYSNFSIIWNTWEGGTSPSSSQLFGPSIGAVCAAKAGWVLIFSFLFTFFGIMNWFQRWTMISL